MVMNELDRRDDPNFDEELAGCAMVDSCSNIISGEQFYNFLNHNFDRHYKTNRAPLGAYKCNISGTYTLSSYVIIWFEFFKHFVEYLG